MNPLAAKGNPFKSRTSFGSVSHSISTEASNARTVSFQFKDMNGKDMAAPVGVFGYMSGADGQSFAAAPAGGIAAGTDGLLIELTDNRAFWAISESDGDLDIVITDASGAATHHITLVLPDGTLYHVTPIAFAA